MSQQRVSSSAALPIAHGLLRILVVVNWLVAALIIVLLFVMPNREWILSAFKIRPTNDAEQLIMGMRAIALLGLVSVGVNYVVLKRLVALVATVRDGDPFVIANAARLQTIAWCLLILQVISIIIGAIANRISTPEHPVVLSAGFSVSAWLAVLLTFLLARVFAEGATMREELEGTV